MDKAAAIIWNLAEDHREMWQECDNRYWFFGLFEEIIELGLALLGWHKHYHPDFDTVEWELIQISSIALNWLRKRHRETGSGMHRQEDTRTR